MKVAVGTLILISLIFSSSAWAEKKKYSIGATLAYDINTYDGDLFDGEDAVNKHVSELRRLKFSGRYKFTDALSVKLSTKYRLHKDEFVLDDAYLRAKLGSRVTMTVGRFKEPFSMENSQGFKYQYLMERSVATNTLTFARKNGIKFLTEGESWGWTLAAMQVKAKDDDFDDAIAYITRFTVAPINSKKKFLHFGAGLSTRNGVEKKYDIDEAVIAPGVGDLIHSVKIAADTLHASNVEFAGKYGPIVLQSEGYYQRIEGRDGLDYQLAGYYATLSWAIMGRSRAYKNGRVEYVAPKKQALELAIRYSLADLESHWDGDVAEVTSICLNYYVRSALRVSLEYEYADLTSYDADDWEYSRAKGNAINARLQLML